VERADAGPREASMPYANLPGVLAEEEKRPSSEALAGCRKRYPDVTVEHKAVHGETRKALSEAGRSARPVVVGARGRGGFAGLLLGSVGQALPHHAHRPVAVVRGTDARR
jgi:nucleotide-binding universal stress UspA family protein